MGERMRIERKHKGRILHRSIVSLVFFAWSIASQSPGLSGAGNKGVDPFDVYAVDGPGEQLLHITVRPNGNQVRVVQEGVLAMPGKPHGIATTPSCVT